MRNSFLALILALPAWAQTAPADLRGVYIYTNDLANVPPIVATRLSQAIALPGIDGAAIVVGWNAIEPAMDKYDFTLFDHWIAGVSALGKKIDLVIPAGWQTPSWLFQAAPNGPGATQLTFNVSPHGGATGVCDTDVTAAPWDPAFLTRWDKLLSAVSAHLKSAGTYNAVSLVRITGINRTTEELRLPAETAKSTGLACVSDSITTWQKAGYKPSLLLQAWNSVIASFQKSFPDKTFAVSIIPNNGFPAIDESGNQITGTPPDYNLPLMTSASQKLPGRLIVQFDFIMNGEAASATVIQYAQTLGTMAAFQTNEYLGGNGAACSEPVTNPTPCTNSTFLTLLETGIYPSGKSSPLRSQYIEVFHQNAADFADSVLKAHFELVPPTVAHVVTAAGENAAIAPNTWVEVKGSGLSLTGHSRIWQGSDFAGSTMPTALDGVSITFNGKAAFVYYISPSQINILTPPDAIAGPVQVVVSNNGVAAPALAATAQALSPSFFTFDGTHVAAIHLNGAYLGPASLYAGLTSPAKPGELITLFGNGFGPTSTPVVSGSTTQAGTMNPVPSFKIGGATANVQFAGLISPGLYQFNVTVPVAAADGDQPISATVNGVTTPAAAVLAVQH